MDSRKKFFRSVVESKPNTTTLRERERERKGGGGGGGKASPTLYLNPLTVKPGTYDDDVLILFLFHRLNKPVPVI